MVDELLLWHILKQHIHHTFNLSAKLHLAPECLASDGCNACDVIQNCSLHTISNKFTGYASVYIRADNHTVNVIFTPLLLYLFFWKGVKTTTRLRMTRSDGEFSSAHRPGWSFNLHRSTPGVFTANRENEDITTFEPECLYHATPPLKDTL